MVATRSSNRQMLSLTPMLWEYYGCKRKCFVTESFLYLFAMRNSGLFSFLSLQCVVCMSCNMYFCKTSCQFWLSVNDLSLWRESRHFDRVTKNGTSIEILNTSFLKPIADTTSIRNRTGLQFCRQMNKTWINENKSPETLFMLAVCLVLHLGFPLEHSKFKMSKPRYLLRIRLRLETSEDHAQVLTRWLANQSSKTSCKFKKGGRFSYRGLLYCFKPITVIQMYYWKQAVQAYLVEFRVRSERGETLTGWGVRCGAKHLKRGLYVLMTSLKTGKGRGPHKYNKDNENNKSSEPYTPK